MRAITALAFLVHSIALPAHAPQHLGSGDSVQPRNTVSRIESVSPERSGVAVDIVGGDAFIRVRSNNQDVLVDGYQGEQFLHIAPDGSVSVNVSSLTFAVNKTRYANTTTYVSSNAPAEWKVVAHNGAYMWHDHRSHWMSPIDPKSTKPDGFVQSFVIPMKVNGQLTTIHGAVYLRTTSPVLWWLFTPLLMAVVWWCSRRWKLGALVTITMASLKTMSIGALEFWSLPAGARITPVLLVFGALALVLSVGAYVWPRMQKGEFAELGAQSLMAGAGATLLVAVAMNLKQVSSGYVPGLSEAWFAQCVIPMATGVAMVALYRGVMKVIRD